MPKSRFFRVAVEGATTDGRQIDRKWLQEMADTYNRDTYAARVNMEHIRGITADPPFMSFGDVLALKTEEVELTLGGKTEKRLALFAEIEALEPLVAMNKKGQKLYSSVEIQPNFAATGKAYLVGLAVTDSPASLGTEMLTFRTKLEGSSPLKLDAANLFTVAEETAIELVEEGTAIAADPTGIFASIKTMIDKFTGAPAAPANPAAPAAQVEAPAPAAPIEASASAEAAGTVALAAVVGQLATTVQAFMTESSAVQAKLTTDLATLTGKIETTPATGFTARPPATGGSGSERTDC